MTLAQLDAEAPHDYDLLVADWQREQEACPKCGRPTSVCGDPNTDWYPQRTVCYADMATSWVRWRYDQLHGSESVEQFHDGTFSDWSKHRTEQNLYGAEDGVTFWVSSEDLSPDDNFLRTEVSGDGSTP